MNSILKNLAWISILITVIWFAMFIRLKTSYVDIPMDYDPWFFYRHAKEIVENYKNGLGLVPPSWDTLSYFPPGRPYFVDGYSYTIAFFYVLVSKFIEISLEKFSVYFVVYYVGFACLIGFALAYYLTRSFFASIISTIVIAFSPAFISVSMAGYVDSDVIYVTYTFLTVLSTLMFLNFLERNKEFWKNKKTILNFLAVFLFSAFSYLLFAFNWNSAYYISNIFLAFLFFYYILEIAKNYFKNKKIILFNDKLFLFFSFISLLIFIQLLSIVLEKIFYPYLALPKPLDTFIGQLTLLIKGGLTHALLVNVSVAELQRISIFSQEVVARVGMFPLYFSIFGISIIFLEKIIKRKEFTLNEMFLFVWFVLSLYLISQGVRFGLLFSTALSIFTGFSVSRLAILISEFSTKLENFLKKKYKEDLEISKFLITFYFASLLVLSFFYISQANDLANNMRGMEVNENWRKALDFLKNNGNETTLVATWWDPGHIFAGYTNLKVHADGAHCGWEHCIPYNHDIRIQDMGRILTTTNETEAYELLKKYSQISQEDCKKVKEAFPFFNESICNIKINKIYFIASQDLIYKFYWPYYFSSCIRKYYPNTAICYTKEGIEEFFYNKKLAEGKVFGIATIDIQNSQENRIKYVSYQAFGNQIIEVPIYLTFRNNSIVGFIRNEPVKEVVLSINNEPIIYKAQDAGYSNTLNLVIFGDPLLTFNLGNLQLPAYLYLADEELANSVFAKLYFLNGKDMKYFKLVFNNPEVKIYEVDI
ncbi:MAG: STT3 domain-containing protein [Candidatus Aenigmatarchaeota archaeon]